MLHTSRHLRGNKYIVSLLQQGDQNKAEDAGDCRTLRPSHEDLKGTRWRNKCLRWTKDTYCLVLYEPFVISSSCQCDSIMEFNSGCLHDMSSFRWDTLMPWACGTWTPSIVNPVLHCSFHTLMLFQFYTTQDRSHLKTLTRMKNFLFFFKIQHSFEPPFCQQSLTHTFMAV